MKYAASVLLLVSVGCASRAPTGTNPSVPVSPQYRVQQGLSIIADANKSTIQLVQALHKQGTLTTAQARDIQGYNADIVTFVSAGTRLMSGNAATKIGEVLKLVDQLNLIGRLEKLQAGALPEGVTATLRVILALLKALMVDAGAPVAANRGLRTHSLVESHGEHGESWRSTENHRDPILNVVPLEVPCCK